MHRGRSLVLLLITLAHAAEIKSSTTPGLSQPSPLEEPLETHQIFPCMTHSNCSSRILTLDTYCCSTTSNCCNWFEFATTYRPSDPSGPLKAPSILTVLVILLLIICFLFVCYCFSILFCFCFKCGIFRRPKVVVLTHIHNSDSGLFAASGNNSPKHSTSSSASTSTSSSYTQVHNRHHHLNDNRRSHRNVSPHSKNYKKKPQNKYRSNNRRSPTARAHSNKRPQYDAEIYVDFDSQQSNTESPFLIPEELNDRVQERLNRSSLNTTNQERRQTALAQCSTTASTATARVTSLQTVPSAPTLDSAESINEIVAVQSEDRRLMTTSIFEPVIGSSLSRSNLSVDSDLAEAHGLAVATTTTATQSVATIQFQYNDDLPPSYDDIIKRNY